MKIAIVGSGPSGLMAASKAAEKNHRVTVYERRPSPGRKILIAGSSGLNITHEASDENFLSHYRLSNPSDRDFLKQALEGFSPRHWIEYVESLGVKCFIGTSSRVLIEEKKSARFLKLWIDHLRSKGVTFLENHELISFKSSKESIQLDFLQDGKEETVNADRAVLALGSPSWEDTVPNWVRLFEENKIAVHPFHSSNVGFELEGMGSFLMECEGKPLKNILLKSSLGEKKGDLMITKYGMEGTPTYFVGAEEEVKIDLRPDLPLEEWLVRLEKPLKENYSPLRRFKKNSGLSEVALSLLFHHSSAAQKSDLKSLAMHAKNIPVSFKKRRPLSESISASGGVKFSELDAQFMLKKFPNIHAIGEMLDWDAPTGGFLIQACVSMGYQVGNL